MVSSSSFGLLLVQFQGEEHVCQLEHLRYLVIDEADRMVEQGHFQELSSILELIHRARYGVCVYRYTRGYSTVWKSVFEVK